MFEVEGVLLPRKDEKNPEPELEELGDRGELGGLSLESIPGLLLEVSSEPSTFLSLALVKNDLILDPASEAALVTLSKVRVRKLPLFSSLALLVLSLLVLSLLETSVLVLSLLETSVLVLSLLVLDESFVPIPPRCFLLQVRLLFLLFRCLEVFLGMLYTLNNTK